MFIVSTIFSAIAWCFIGTGLFCIQLEFLEQKTRMFQFAVLMAISGLYGFFISAVTGRLIDYLFFTVQEAEKDLH